MIPESNKIVKTIFNGTVNSNLGSTYDLQFKEVDQVDRLGDVEQISKGLRMQPFLNIARLSMP